MRNFGCFFIEAIVGAIISPLIAWWCFSKGWDTFGIIFSIAFIINALILIVTIIMYLIGK